MSIESLVNQIQENRSKYGLDNPLGATPAAVAVVAKEFEELFQYPLPEAYQRFLLISDGILENGLTMWPSVAERQFHESIITANQDLRENVSDNFLYFGQRDDSVFVLDTRDHRYLAIELNGLAEWNDFLDCNTMIEFILERALD